jgi:hypothetical protein
VTLGARIGRGLTELACVVPSPAKNPGGYCPNHATGVKLPDDFVVTPLQYVD